MRPGCVASCVACTAGMSPPPRTLGAALPERTGTLPIGLGSGFPSQFLADCGVGTFQMSRQYSRIERSEEK